MDLTRDITYNGVHLNDAQPALGKPGISGCETTGMTISTIGVMQYADKAYQHDGTDFQGVGNLAIGQRTIDLQGTLYGPTRAGLYDLLDEVRTALDPVQAYAADQFDYGFLPLSWVEPGGSRYINARPEGLKHTFDRDKHGTAAKVVGQEDATALALQWTCRFTTRDPRVYGASHSVTLPASGTLTNAGNYPSLYDLTLVLSGSSGTVSVNLGGKTFVSALAAGTSGRILRYRGLTRLMTLEDTGLSAHHEILRMDLLDFTVKNSDTQHPLFQPGANAYSVSASGVGILGGSTLVAVDAYA